MLRDCTIWLDSAQSTAKHRYKWKGKEKENVAAAAPKVQLNLLLCSVKPDDAKVRFCFLIVNQVQIPNTKPSSRVAWKVILVFDLGVTGVLWGKQTGESHRFQASSESEMKTWLAVIAAAIGCALTSQVGSAFLAADISAFLYFYFGMTALTWNFYSKSTPWYLAMMVS